MNWKFACFIALMMWSIYGFFGERAAKVHGEKINVIFEALAFVLLAIVAAISVSRDFRKITTNSAFNAFIMGTLSAAGLWFVFYAMKVAPQKDLITVILISGMFPVGAAIVSNFIIAQLSLLQWTGVILAGIGIVLVNLPH